MAKSCFERHAQRAGHLPLHAATRSMVNGARCVRFDKVEAATDPAEPGRGGSEGSGEDGEDDGNHQLG